MCLGRNCYRLLSSVSGKSRLVRSGSTQHPQSRSRSMRGRLTSETSTHMPLNPIALVLMAVIATATSTIAAIEVSAVYRQYAAQARMASQADAAIAAFRK